MRNEWVSDEVKAILHAYGASYSSAFNCFVDHHRLLFSCDGSVSIGK